MDSIHIFFFFFFVIIVSIHMGIVYAHRHTVFQSCSQKLPQHYHVHLDSPHIDDTVIFSTGKEN